MTILATYQLINALVVFEDVAESNLMTFNQSCFPVEITWQYWLPVERYVHLWSFGCKSI